MKIKDKENRFLELEKQAMDIFLDKYMDLHGLDSIIAYLDEDERKEYYQLEKEI